MYFSFEPRIFIGKLVDPTKLVDTGEYFLHNSAWKGEISK
jgi:hypothetical protein